MMILEFDPCGIPLSEWEDKQAHIEAALNITIAKIFWRNGKKIICVYAVPAKDDFAEILPWKEEYLSSRNFTLVLGESMIGTVTVSLTRTPHILLGGSAGSGKSVLLKLMLMQALKKGANVYIADFKGGVDFPPIWHQKCRMCFEEQDLLDLLSKLADELQHCKELFSMTGCQYSAGSNQEQYGLLHLRQGG